ncbi:FKBP-type peptidyl-prolyl cis-trans isomerase [Crocinitomicaceae bacterium]|nr:FKBP-type peptidyl-prolyl cis-trans isomerase [Crocinitomicaceae bacterium]
MIRILSILSIGLVLLSCGETYSKEEKTDFDKRIERYLNKKNIKCTRSSSGLYYKIVDPGEGDLIKLKDRVSFTYKGTFLNGKVFDERQEPVEFSVQTLIGAWKEVMLYLRPGGKAFIVTPPQLGYGEHDLDDIPPNSILVFELEVKSVL